MQPLHVLYLIIAGVGMYFIANALIRIISAKQCTQVVDAWFLDIYYVVKIKGRNIKKAKFFYEYDGKEYTYATDLGISVKQMNSFLKGQKYKIFVNPKKPQKCAFERKPTFGSDIFPLIIGVLIITLPLWFMPLMDFIFQLKIK